MTNHSVQRFIRREETAMRERTRVVMPEALPEADPDVIEEIARLDAEDRARLEARRGERDGRRRPRFRHAEPFNPVIIRNK